MKQLNILRIILIIFIMHIIRDTRISIQLRIFTFYLSLFYDICSGVFHAINLLHFCFVRVNEINNNNRCLLNGNSY